MGKTSISGHRHVREIFELFSIVGEVTKGGFEDILGSYANRKALRQSLKRMIERGFIKETPNSFFLTNSGFAHFRKPKPASKDTAKWDGKWRIISFDVPVGKNQDRARLRALLKDFGFYQLQKSLWICPNSLSADAWQIIVKGKLNKYCQTMVVEIMEGEEGLKKYFHLK